MVELHRPTLVQISLATLEHTTNTSQTVHRLCQASILCTRDLHHSRSSHARSRRSSTLKLSYSTMVLLVGHCRGTLCLLALVAIVMFLSSGLTFLLIHPRSHHAGTR